MPVQSCLFNLPMLRYGLFISPHWQWIRGIVLFWDCPKKWMEVNAGSGRLQARIQKWLNKTFKQRVYYTFSNLFSMFKYVYGVIIRCFKSLYTKRQMYERTRHQKPNLSSCTVVGAKVNTWGVVYYLLGPNTYLRYKRRSNLCLWIQFFLWH